MKIDWIRIKGFRNFDNEIIHFNDKTLIIGGNDVGKTNLLYAMRILLDKSLSIRDLELNECDYNAYTKATEIEITIKIVDVVEDCLLSTFAGHVESETTYIRYCNSVDGEMSIWAGISENLLEEKSSRFYLKRLNLEYVDTNRDLFNFIKRERRGLLQNSKEMREQEEIESDKIAESKIQKGLNNLNKRIDKLNYVDKSLEKVNNELKELAIHNEDQLVKFTTGNTESDQLINNLQLSYATGNSSLKIGGDGRNNQIFLAMWVAKQQLEKSQHKVTLFAIEEPEAHLHPHQQRKLSDYLINNFDNQVFITSHSPQIATDFKPNRIARLYLDNKITKVAQGGCSQNIEMEFDDFGYRLNIISAESFFANGVFLVEGPSEIIFYKALAKSLDIDLDRLGISIVSVNGVGFKSYIKIFIALEIPFVMRTDDDVFKKPKKKPECHYCAGISRVAGIYKELLAEGEDEIVKYWERNKADIEWVGCMDDITEKALKLNNYMRKNLNEHNIFLAYDNLESDLVDSSINDMLKNYHGVENDDELTIAMSSAKATSMLGVLEENYDEKTDSYPLLRTLDKDHISKPLHRLVEIIEGVVHPNE